MVLNLIALHVVTLNKVGLLVIIKHVFRSAKIHYKVFLTIIIGMKEMSALYEVKYYVCTEEK